MIWDTVALLLARSSLTILLWPLASSCLQVVNIYTLIYFSFVFGTASYSNVRILISVCFPFIVRVALRDWIWADFGCMDQKSWSQFWKIQLLSDGFCFFNIYLHQLLAVETGSFLSGCFHCLCHRPWKIGYYPTMLSTHTYADTYSDFWAFLV